MPFYQFACDSCRQPEDVEMRMSENTSAPRTCPSCGGVSRRVFLSPSVISAREGVFNPSEDDEPIWRENARWIERTLATATDGREWVPAPSTPKRFQPDMARVAELKKQHQAKQAATPKN